MLYAYNTKSLRGSFGVNFFDKMSLRFIWWATSNTCKGVEQWFYKLDLKSNCSKWHSIFCLKISMFYTAAFRSLLNSFSTSRISSSSLLGTCSEAGLLGQKKKSCCFVHLKHWKWCTWHRKASAKTQVSLTKFLQSEVKIIDIIVQNNT